MNRRNIWFQYWYHGYAKHWVFVFPSTTYKHVYLIVDSSSIYLTNSYGGKMPGYLSIGLFWNKWWKHGIRWCWINKPEPQEV